MKKETSLTEQEVCRIDNILSDIGNIDFDITRLQEKKVSLNALVNEAISKGYKSPDVRLKEEQAQNQARKKEMEQAIIAQQKADDEANEAMRLAKFKNKNEN